MKLHYLEQCPVTFVWWVKHKNTNQNARVATSIEVELWQELLETERQSQELYAKSAGPCTRRGCC